MGIAALLLAAFFYSASAGIANLASSLYMLDLAGSAEALALLAAVYNSSFAASSLTLVGRRGRSAAWRLRASLVAVSASTAAMAATSSPVLLLAFNTAYGLSAALVQPAILAIASSLVSEAEAVPRVNMASSIGIVLGDAVAAALAPHLKPRGLLALSALLAAVAAAASHGAPERPGAFKTLATPSAPLVTGRARYTPPTVPARVEAGGGRLPESLQLGVLAFFAGVALFFSPMPAYLREVGFSDSTIYLLSMTALLTSTLLYEALRRAKPTLYTAYRLLVLVPAIRIAVFLAPMPAFAGLVDPYLLMPLVYVAIGATWAMISTALPVIALKMGGEQALGRVNAMMSLGLLAGSTAVAPLTALATWKATCPAAAIAAAVSLVLYYHSKKQLKD